MLKEDLIKAIYTVAKRKAAQYENYHNSLEIEFQRNARRTTDISPKIVKNQSIGT